NAVAEVAAVISRCRQVLCNQVHCRRAEPGRWNEVVWECRSGIGIDQCLGTAGGLAGRRVHYAEISIQRRGRRQKSERWRGRLPITRALIASEEEKSFSPDGSAKSSAELVPLQSIVLGGKEVACVERSIAQKLEHVSMEPIRS